MLYDVSAYLNNHWEPAALTGTIACQSFYPGGDNWLPFFSFSMIGKNEGIGIMLMVQKPVFELALDVSDPKVVHTHRRGGLMTYPVRISTCPSFYQ